MWTVVREILTVINESAIYLLGGFALAGILHVALRRTPGITNLLAARGVKSVVLAALFGAPLPLCSCGVVPAGLTLRKKGASNGATVSFLISAPETDVTSILLTYALLGPVMAVFRPIAALITAVVAGLATSVVERLAPEAFADGGSCQAGCRETEGGEYDTARGPIWNALHYGFVRFFDDIIGSLLLGLIVGGLIAAFLPQLGIDRLPGGSFVAMLAMVVVGIPMYVCATSSTPIAAGLIAGGVSPGAALVFLLAGPASNLGSIFALRKYLGRPVLATYLISIAVTSVLMGLWLDAAFDRSTIRAIASTPSTAADGALSVLTAGAIVLAVLTCFSLYRTKLLARAGQRLAGAIGISATPRQVKAVAALLLVLIYATSGLFAVGPGQRGIVTRFGRIVRTDLPPGLHCSWPWPVDQSTVESVSLLRSLEIGFRRGDKGALLLASGAGEDAESRMLTGHEDIIDIKWVVQYRLKESARGLEEYVFGLEDPVLLVRSAAEASIRLVVGCRGIDTLLTADRGDVESAVRTQLQSVLNGCAAGITVARVCLLDVHPPGVVLWAFRDVASAGEDKMRTVNQAYEYTERVLPQADGESCRLKAAARGRAVESAERAKGKAGAFSARLAAFQESPRVTRLRLHLEGVDLVLPRLKKYVCLSDALCDGIELWLLKSGTDVNMPPGLSGPVDRPQR
jgi:HflK protein